MKPYVLFLSCTLALSATAVQAQFSISGELRTRAEYRHGYAALPAPDADAAFFVSQRSRALFGYKTDNLALGMTLQDVRVWGDEELTKDEPSIGLHEAWADISFSDVLGVKFGRQELAYDDQRVLGSSDWTAQGRSHDAAVLHFRSNGWKADLAGAFNQKSEALFDTKYITTNYKVLGFLWLNKEVSKEFKISLLGIGDGFQKTDSTTDVVFRYTYGFHAEYSGESGISAKATFYNQSGSERSGKDIAAYFAAGSLGYRYDNVGAILGCDLVSGTDATETQKNNTFSTLYGTNHRLYGTMDYFTALPTHTKGGGLVDLYAALLFDPVKQLKLRLDIHSFSLAADIANPAAVGTTLDKGLGTEVDLTITYTVSPIITVLGGYSQMFATESMEVLKGGSKDETANWLWMSVSIKPTFL